MVEVDVKVEGPGNKNVHNNAFYAEETLLRSELQAIRDCNPLSARHWIVRFFSHCSVLTLFSKCFNKISTFGSNKFE